MNADIFCSVHNILADHLHKKCEKNILSFSGTPVPSGQPCNYPEGSFAPVPDQQTGLCLCKVYRLMKKSYWLKNRPEIKNPEYQLD